MDIQKTIDKALSLSRSTKALVFGNGVLDRTAGVFEQYFPGRKALVLADSVTWKVAGETVSNALRANGIDTEDYVITDPVFLPEWSNVLRIDDVMAHTGGILVAVGAGVINDIAKICSFRAGQDYICVATVASVDGYSSAGAVINDASGVKKSISCKAPVAVIADTGIIAGAPARLSAAGYADLTAKVSSGAEWMIADLFGTEPIHKEAWDLTQGCLKDMLDDPEGVAQGRPESIGKLFLGLTLAGIGMEVAGSSRPASCSEHLFDLILSMSGHRHEGKVVPHGFQVAIGELTMCAFFDAFLDMDLSRLDVDACVRAWPSLEEERKRATAVFEDFVVPTLGCEMITKKWQDAGTIRMELEKVRDGWPALKAALRAQVWTFEETRERFRIVGVPVDPSEIGLTRRQLRDMCDKVQLLRWRINLFDLAKRACIYDTLMDKVFGKGGVWQTD